MVFGINLHEKEIHLKGSISILEVKSRFLPGVSSMNGGIPTMNS